MSGVWTCVDRSWGGLSQTEIAGRLGVSQMHVSRLLARTVDRLRAVAEARA